MRPLAVLLLLVPTVLIAAGPTSTHAVDKIPQESDFHSIFNGQDLTGWYGREHLDPRSLSGLTPVAQALARAKDRPAFEAHWKVSGGILVNDGEGPLATATEEFDDAELRLEYKLTARADGGIYLRGNPQVQLWDTTEAGGRWNVGAQFGSGGLWNNSPGSPGKDPLAKADKPLGEWNKVRVVQIGERTWVWLNGQVVVDGARMENYWDHGHPLPRAGAIQLQSQGGQISWRNIEARTINASEANRWLGARDATGFVSVFDGKDWKGWSGPLDNYAIEDGTIACRPNKGGTIFTAQEYTDFAVRLEIRLPAAGNNGLAIRYPGEGDTAYVGMCEVQTLDNDAPDYARLDPRQYHGSVYGMVPAARGYLRPVGQWNYEEVTVKGSRIDVELNGTRILDADVATVTEFMDGKAHPGKDRTSGHFGFAGHNDPVAYRNIRIKPLTKE